MRTSGGTNTPQVFTQGRPRGEEETYKKRSQRARGLSLFRARAHSLSFSSHLLGWHAPTPRGYIFLYFLNKTEGAITLRELWCTKDFNVRCFKFLLRGDKTEEITLPWHFHFKTPSYPPKETWYLLTVTLIPSLRSPTGQAATKLLLSPWIYQFWTFHINEVI